MIGYRTLAAAAIFAAGVAVGAPAQAQNITADPNAVAAVLKGQGLTVEMTKDNDGDPLIRSSFGENQGFSVYFYGCTNHLHCTTMQFYAGFKESKADTTKINEWNRTKRFGRAYIDTDGQPAVEMDVDLDDGGMSKALFIDNLEFWQALMKAFPDFIYGNG